VGRWSSRVTARTTTVRGGGVDVAPKVFHISFGSLFIVIVIVLGKTSISKRQKYFRGGEKNRKRIPSAHTCPDDDILCIVRARARACVLRPKRRLTVVVKNVVSYRNGFYENAVRDGVKRYWFFIRTDDAAGARARARRKNKKRINTKTEPFRTRDRTPPRARTRVYILYDLCVYRYTTQVCNISHDTDLIVFVARTSVPLFHDPVFLYFFLCFFFFLTDVVLLDSPSAENALTNERRTRRKE